MRIWKKIVLALMLMLAACMMLAAAEASYPESGHPYENNADQSWEYAHPTAAEYLKICFSDDTATEQSFDVITITDAEGNARKYSGTSLAGRSIYLQGDSFTIRLTSDSSVTAYGFHIVEIAASTKEAYEAYISQPVFTVSNGTLTGYSGPNQVVVPEKVDGQTVTSIGAGAFKGSSVVSVEMPETVTSLANYAFQNCESLTEISIPSGVKVIPWYAFDGCTSLKEIQLCEGLEEIKYSAFRSCSALTELDIPSGVTGIGDYAFYSCTALERVELPKGLTTLGNGVFMYCSALTEAILPESLNSISENTFNHCVSLKQIQIPSDVTEILSFAFNGCRSLTTLQLPDTVTSIGKGAFDGCTGLAEIRLPARLTEIPEFAFNGCRSLTTLQLPETVTGIGKGAFAGCTGLAEFALPAKLSSIGSGAFDGGTVLRVGSNAYARQYAIDNGYQYISDSDRVTCEDIDTVEEKIDWIVSNYLTSGMSEYQRALKLYDWLCMHVAYDYDYLETRVPTGAHGVCGEGALLDGTAVCQGYAEAYKWLLERAGIEAILVSGVARYSGGGHAWNLARIDGKWYQFDATWDESGNGSDHDYFGLTDAAMEVDHRRDTSLGMRCNSWAANYKFRNGMYDETLEQLRVAVEEKLSEGNYSATISVGMGWRSTDRQMLADIISADSWSVSGRVELVPVGSGDNYEMTFFPDEVPVTSISILGVDDAISAYCMYPGYAVRLEVATEPQGVPVRFVSLDETVVTVDENGLATAVAEGSTEIQVIAGNAVYRLAIKVISLDDMTFRAYFEDTGNSTAYLNIGETRQAALHWWYPLLLDGASFNWCSADESIVTVDASGLVRAVGYGATTIRVEWRGKSRTLNVNVRIPARGVTLEQHFYETVADGAQMRIYANLDCADPAAYYQNTGYLRWASSDASVLSVWGHTWHNWNPAGYYDMYGGVFDVKAPGAVVVTVTARDESGVSDRCTVVVHSASRMILPVKLNRIEAEAFSGSAAEEFVLPEGVKAIESRAFAGCIGLKLLNLPSSVTEIADDAFEGCGALTLLCREGSVGAAFAARMGIPFVCVP